MRPIPRASTVSMASGSCTSQTSDHGLIANTTMEQASAALMKHTGRRISMRDASATTPPLSYPYSNHGLDPQSHRQQAYSFDVMPAQQPKPMAGISNVQYNPSPPMSSVSSTTPVVQGGIIPSVVNSSHGGASLRGGSVHTVVSAVSGNTTLTAPVLNDTRSLSNVTVLTSQSDVNLGMMYPDFLRNRTITDRHMAVPREIDHGLLMESEKERMGSDASHGDMRALLKLKNEKRDEKE